MASAALWVPRTPSNLSTRTSSDGGQLRRWAMALSFLYLAFVRMPPLFRFRRTDRGDLTP